ncbi:aerolysin-like protein [Colossoma macropomum]|uniref:aerolysin-like protein n=1 Tax=Colossoma macropomum TaxID=42526 RepID=UPI00186539BB|nr:aerolysin-like protein [Colossoma macropomum]
MSYLAPVLDIGGNGGTPFDFRGTDSGASLEKIRVWAGGWQIRSIKVWLTNGEYREFGKAEGDYSEYTFKPGELITSLSLWDNAEGDEAGTRLGAIKFTTTLDGSFFSKMTELDLQKEYPIDVGSGVCMGIVGLEGEDIDKLGFLFINPIKSTFLTNTTYPTLYDVIPQVAIEELKSMTYQNDTSVTQEYTLETSEKVVKKSSWSTTNKIESTFSVTVKAAIPVVAEVESGFSFTEGMEDTYSLEYSEEKEEKVSVPVQVPPGKSVYAKACIGRAVIDLPYTGTVRITCYNESMLEFNISGIYSGLTYTTADVHVVEHVKSQE